MCFGYTSNTWAGGVGELSRCTCQHVPVSSVGSEPGEAGSCEKTPQDVKEEHRLVGPGRQRWGYKMGPDHRGSERLDKAIFYVLGRREPLQAFLFQAGRSADDCLRRFIG